MKKIGCCLLLLVAACTTPASRLDRIVPASAGSPVAATDVSYQTLGVGDTSRDKAISPAWYTSVSDEAIATALSQSLSARGLLASAKPRYIVDARMVDYFHSASPKPDADVSMHYVVKARQGGAVLFEETIKTHGTSKVSDGRSSGERARAASESAVRDNLTSFMGKLTTALASQAPAAQLAPAPTPAPAAEQAPAKPAPKAKATSASKAPANPASMQH